MSKQPARTPSAPVRTSFHSQLLQSAAWLGWAMPTPATAPPRPPAASPAVPHADATPTLGLPAGSEPA